LSSTATSKDPRERRKIKKKREIRVFVSSTFKDMAGEREELTKKVFPQVIRYSVQ
jgi:hypothetical protein